MKKKKTIPVLLSIAGSDSGGGAGIQADLKTFQAFGCFGTSALTAVTCQNTKGVGTVQPITPTVAAEQIEKVLEDFTIAAAKTGMLFSAEIIRSVRKVWEEKSQEIPLVIDPVMTATSGVRLLETEKNALTKSGLENSGLTKNGLKKSAAEELLLFLSYAAVITPNLPEAECLLGRPLKTILEVREAAKELSKKYQAVILLKGGHHEKKADTVVDVYYDAKSNMEELIKYPRLKTRNTHGTGCTLSAAIAACLAKGMTSKEAVLKARAYLQKAIAMAPHLGSGFGPVNHFWNNKIQAG